MPISFACKCGKRLAAKDGLAGKKIKCSGCGATVNVPSDAVAPPSVPQPAMLSVSCSCGKRLKAKPESAGKRIKCPQCNESVLVPSEPMESSTTKKAASKASSAEQPKPSKSPPPSQAIASAAPGKSKPHAPPPTGKGSVATIDVGKKKKRSGPEMLIAGGVLGLLVVVGVVYYFVSLPTSSVVAGTVELDKQLVLMGRVELVAANGKKVATEIGVSGTFVLKDVPFGDATITVNVPIDKVKVYEGRIKSLKSTYLTMRRPPPAIKPATVPIPVEYTDAKKTPFKLNVQGARMEYPLEMRGKS